MRMKMLPLLSGMLLLLMACIVAPVQAWTSDNGDGTYTNPLWYADYPDPDIIRVGKDFYMTSTTMVSMPGVPIFHSTDLVNWKILTYASPSLEFSPAYNMKGGTRYAHGTWAPSFRYHKGTYYILVCTLDEGSVLFQAKTPNGPWKTSKPKAFLYDPGLLFDDDGTPYVFHGMGGNIKVTRMTPDLMREVETKQVLSVGDGEGSHAYKINGMYYVFNAIGGPKSRMYCSRSKNIFGPYETVTILDDKTGWKGSHQGGIVDLPNGTWWGFSMSDEGAIGRVTNLSPITWKDGWPYYGVPGRLGQMPLTAKKPDLGVKSPILAFPHADDFSKPQLGLQWQWNHNPDNARWSLRERPGWMRLRASTSPDYVRARNTLTQRTEGRTCTATIKMDIRNMRPGDRAGLSLLESQFTYLAVYRDKGGSRLVRVVNRNSDFAKPSEDITSTLATSVPSDLWMRLSCDFNTNKARFFYSLDGKTFVQAGDDFTMQYNYVTFQGERIGIFNYNTAGTGGYIDVDWFQFTNKPLPE